MQAAPSRRLSRRIPPLAVLLSSLLAAFASPASAVTGGPRPPGGDPPAATGYWVVTASGAVRAFGGAAFRGDGVPAGFRVTGIAPTADGDGYWLLTAEGRAFGFGDASGSPVVPAVAGSGFLPLAGPAGSWAMLSPSGRAVVSGGTGSAGESDLPGVPPGTVAGAYASPAGGALYGAEGEGDVVSLGAAGAFSGRAPGLPSRLGAPVVAMALVDDGSGYYLAGGDGGVFAAGAARFRGSMGGKHLNRPIVGMAVAPGGGYYLVASDGGVFAFGAPFYGSCPAAGSGCAGLTDAVGIAALP